MTPDELGRIAYEAACHWYDQTYPVKIDNWKSWETYDQLLQGRWVNAARAVKEALESWISVSDGLPFVDHDNNYERSYTRVIAQLDNNNIREMAYVEESREQEGFWLETNGKKPINTVTHWMYFPKGVKSGA